MAGIPWAHIRMVGIEKLSALHLWAASLKPCPRRRAWKCAKGSWNGKSNSLNFQSKYNLILSSTVALPSGKYPRTMSSSVIAKPSRLNPPAVCCMGKFKNGTTGARNTRSNNLMCIFLHNWIIFSTSKFKLSDGFYHTLNKTQ